MAKRFVVPFAATGDKTAAPDATDPSGAISYSQGWGAQYQLPNTDPSYRPVGRQEMNGVLNDVTAAIGDLQLNGFPEWVAVGGLVPPYPINACVRWSNTVWRSTVANNSAQPGTAASNWQVLDSHGISRIATSGSFTVPPGVTQLYASGCAGGGGGGSSQASTTGFARTGGSGGGAGQAAIRVAIAVTPGQVIPVTIGAGGVGASAGSNNAGSGGPTQLGTAGSLLNLAGGSPGQLGTGGNLVPASFGGPQGGAGFPQGGTATDTNVFSGGPVGASTGGGGGKGASSPFGESGPAGRGAENISPPAAPGTGFGAGGSGAGGAYSTVSSQGGGAGAAGLPGILILEW